MSELPFERAFRAWVARQGMAWEQLRCVRPEAGGESLAYRITPAQPPRAVVLAVHGAGNDALFGLVGLFKELLLRGYEVFSFDLDGHGRGSSTRFDRAAVAGAIPAAVARCSAAERGLPLHALGVSLGGSVLLHALPGLSPALASATLCCAPLRVQLSWRSIAGELGPGLLRTLWRERAHYGLTGLIPSFGPFKRHTYPLRLAAQPGPGAFGYVEVINDALDSMRLEEVARRVTTPVLLIYGAEDRLVPAEQGQRLDRALQRSELLLLPGETHLTVPLAPRAVARMLGWLASHTPAHPSRSIA